MDHSGVLVCGAEELLLGYRYLTSCRLKGDFSLCHEAPVTLSIIFEGDIHRHPPLFSSQGCGAGNWGEGEGGIIHENKTFIKI